jgi:hypothetical protein
MIGSDDNFVIVLRTCCLISRHLPWLLRISFVRKDRNNRVLGGFLGGISKVT